MEKLLRLLPLFAFSGFLVKTILFSPSIPDALILFALVSYIVAEQLRLKDAQIKEFDKKLHDFTKKHDEQTQELKTLQGHVNSIKLGVGLRQVSNTPRS